MGAYMFREALVTRAHQMAEVRAASRGAISLRREKALKSGWEY